MIALAGLTAHKAMPIGTPIMNEVPSREETYGAWIEANLTRSPLPITNKKELL